MTATKMGLLIILGLLFSAPAVVAQTDVRAVVKNKNERKPAAELNLRDSSGRLVRLANYRGKVLLLDFWATWCHGCKEEIPWFSEFQHKYEHKGLRVVGISLDEDGWKAVRPFINTAGVPYRIALGNNVTASKYGIDSMPDTFLIDRNGRIAAKYTGLVDKDNLEANIRKMLAQD